MTRPARKSKPQKPYPEYPLHAHGSGQWSKKILGKVHYFGVWSDPQGALEAYLAKRDYLHAGQAPPITATTLADILNAFHESKQHQLDTGNLTQRSFSEYEAVCDRIAKVLGKHRAVEGIGPSDLSKLRTELCKGKNGEIVGPSSQKRRLTMARSVFYYANEELGCTVRYKKHLRSPSARVLRQARNEAGERLFTAEQIRALLEAAGEQLKAMIYLGINCGFGNADCATLPVEQVDLTNGWHTYWRPKTQVPRRCPLWPETAAALYAVIRNRTDGLVFETKYGNTWTGKGRACPISLEFRKLVTKLGIHRSGKTTFYSLRRTFQTVGETAGEPKALEFIMGHTPVTTDMSAIYRQKIYNGPLLKVTDRVKGWLDGSITL